MPSCGCAPGPPIPGRILAITFTEQQESGLALLLSVSAPENIPCPPPPGVLGDMPQVRGRHRKVPPAALRQQTPPHRQSAPGRREAQSTGAVRRFAAFAIVGAVVFIAGTALQWALLRETPLTSDWSYALQTLFSIELSFALNKRFTWADRDATVVRELVRWNIQKAALAVPNVVLYDWLDHRTGDWMAANVIATGAFIVINFLAGNFWSFASSRTRKRRLSFAGTTVAAMLVALPVAIAMVPQARILVYVAWMLPLAELTMLLAGTVFFRRRFREAMPGTFNGLIVQITTAGKEPKRVSEIISQIRGYDLLHAL